jgi:hypothetical protein
MMESQSLKSLSFLIVVIFCIFLSNNFLRWVNRRKCGVNSNLYLLKFNYFFPILSYLAFTDQLDESYIWASKVENFLTSGRLGVTLYDGVYGESSVSIIQFLIASFLKVLLPITYEQALFLPGIFSVYALVYFWIKTTQRLALSKFSSIMPLGFLASSLAFIQNLSFSFDVSLSLLALFYVYQKSRSHKSFTIAVLLVVGLMPLIRIEFFAFAILVFFCLVVQSYREKSSLLLFIRSVLIIFGPLILAFIYKRWAFGDVLPAMVHFKTQEYDLETVTRIVAYYVRAFGYTATGLIVIGAIFIFFKVNWKVTLKECIVGFISLPIFQGATLVFIGLLFLTPLMAGSDYHGERLQRYLIVPISLCVFIFFMKHNISFGDSRMRVFKEKKVLTFFLAILIAISAESHMYALSEGKWFSFDSRPSRAHCDELIGPKLREFWKSKSDKPLVIATSEANGISFSSGAKLLDLAGVVDARNYPANLDPIFPGNLYGRYSFKDTIAREKPSILWPYMSEYCTFYNPLTNFENRDELQVIERVYSSIWAKYWFPSINELARIGYCIGRVQTKEEDYESYAAFLYYCKGMNENAPD